MCLKVQSVHIWNSFIKDLEKNAISCRSQQASHFFSLGENEFPKYFPSGEISSLDLSPSSLSVGVLVGFQELDPVTR